MFFEASYLPSPQFSTTSLDDSNVPEQLSPIEEALPPPQLDDAAEETPVNHLVFVIHGIGQQTEQYGHFYEHVESLQETTRQVLQAKVPDHNVRIELIPIEWHRHIHDQVDPILNRITLKSIPTIRLIENEYLADVLFYFSKDRGQSIIDNVTRLFNTSYHNFMEKHPDFDGKIVILGYSLGGILTWDILAHQRQPTTQEEEQDYRKLDVIYGKLDFKPNYFFSLGSPIGAVLTFRNQSPVTYHPDYDIVFENLFHPFDPLAYRIEPLYDEYYTEQPAVLVERSVPIGPSFSFPSLPSLPGMGLFSFFSWKMSSSNTSGEPNQDDRNENTSNMLDEADAATGNKANHMHSNPDTDDISFYTTKNNTPAPTNLPPSIVSDANKMLGTQRDGPGPMEDEQGKSIMTSLLQYFSKGRRGSKGASDSKNNSTTTSMTTTSDIGEREHEPPSPNDNMHGIITWDPLQEQRRAVLSSDISKKALATEKDNHHQVNSSNDSPVIHSTSSSTSTSRRPLQRAKTYCAQGISDSNSSMLFYEIDKSDYTVFGEGCSVNSEDMDTLVINNINGGNSNSTSTEHKNEETPHPKLRHLVEVLGIDGVRLESFERAKVNFPRNTNHSYSQHPSEEQGNNKETTSSTHHLQKEGITTHGDNTSSHQPLNQAKEIINERTTIPEAGNSDLVGAMLNGPDNDNILRSSEDEKTGQQEQHQQTEGSAVESEEDEATKKAQEEEAQAQQALKHLPGDRRMDFALQPDGFMSMIANEYIVGLRAHFSYWTSKDLMWHIVQTLEK